MLLQVDIKGNIIFVADIINESGIIMDCKAIESKYNLTINFLYPWSTTRLRVPIKGFGGSVS